ncbi:Rpn family recombination-promoting nuclease/putative transposase [Winslowiella iniecta]|uniref:Transposase n=1 Tax=Winslowiella iniecta TaxID=1560201 RepID=A0A0L7T7U7_9GAMM|nr:Rpn family recombination-promoting nuclease/putative transposase [Winslowiella iniecta]KOC91448.1 transposase [Winslowiella iniecta]KOC92091.1 transposase [Winslowiella iniecta]
MGITPTPHDAVFKQFLSDRETARDFLQIHLPPSLLNRCDLDTLQLTSGSFVEDHLRAFHSDVLYSLKTDSGEGYIYCLIEHQSTEDELMAFRLMRYAIAAMQQHLKAGHKQLPLVIPIHFYHGQKSPYPHSMNWLVGFGDPELAGQIYGSDFPLVDVTVIPDDEIMTHRRMAALELLQKHIRLRDMSELLEHLVTLMSSGYTTNEQLVVLMNYIVQAGETADPESFIRELAVRSPQQKEILMTIAEKFEQKGVEKGLEKGLEKGRKEGIQDVARNMLAKGWDIEKVQEMTGLDEDEVKTLLINERQQSGI